MCKLYTYVYLIGNKLPKRDKLGINNYIEKEILKIISLLINASFEQRVDKIIKLKKAHVQIETLKQLIRIEYEIKLITEKVYLKIEENLQEISRMTNGWLKYTETQTPSEGGVK